MKVLVRRLSIAVLVFIGFSFSDAQSELDNHMLSIIITTVDLLETSDCNYFVWY